MTGSYYGGNYGYGGGAAAIIIIIVIIIIICIVIFAFAGFRKDDQFGHEKGRTHGSRKGRRGYNDGEFMNGMNGMNEINGENGNGNGGLDPNCDVAAICRNAFQTGENGAQQILNTTLDFLDTKPSDLGKLADVSNNFNGYPLVIKPGQGVDDSVLLFHINPNIVGIPIGRIGSSEVTNSTAAILRGAKQGHKIVCYPWQGRTKFTLVSPSRDGKLVVASGFHLDATQ